MTDPAEIRRLERTVRERPEDNAARTLYARALHRIGRSQDALEQAAEVIARVPDSEPALWIAAAAATEIGDTGRAAAYRRLLQAMGFDPDTEPMFPEPVPATADDLIGRWEGIEPGDVAVGDVYEPDVTMSDVGGMEKVKARLESSFFQPLRNPELREAFNKSVRGGLLLYGPPGCGKTYLAKAVAGEIGARFYSVGLADVLDMWIGSSERNLHEVFETARRLRPCVLFLDEIDALGHKRGQLRNMAMRGVVNQLLMEMDGVDTDNEDVFILAATNHPWDIDPALLRPGRFDRMVFVGPPDQAAREAILEVHLRKRPLADDIDLRSLAAHTDGYTGADLALVTEAATERALGESVAAGTVLPIDRDDLEAALADVKPTGGGWFDIARNHVLFGTPDSRFDELATYLGVER